MRLVNPRAEIRAAGGREGHLRALERARALARELALRRGLPDDARRRARRHLPDDPRRRLRGGRQSAPARRDARAAQRRRAASGCGGDGEILRPEVRAEPSASALAAAAAVAHGISREIAAEKLAGIRARGTYRRMRVLEGAQAPRMRVDGRDVLLFAGSNYLDLARHPEVVEASARAAREIGCAAGGSRLISGNLDVHEALEQELAKFFEAEAALAFSSGYMANLGVIPALVGAATRSSRTRSPTRRSSTAAGSRAPTCACSRTATSPRSTPRSRDAAREHRRVLLAIDGVYSMDGDVAPLRRAGRRARSATARSCCSTTRTAPARSARTAAAAPSCAASKRRRRRAARHARQGARLVRRVRGRHARAARAAREHGALVHLQLRARAAAGRGRARRAATCCAREPWRRERLPANAARLRARLARHGVATRAEHHAHRAGRDRRERRDDGGVRARCSSAASTRRGSAIRRCPRAPRGCASRRWRRTARTRSTRSPTPSRTRWRAIAVTRRRARGVFVTGTDTGVGKTVVGVRARARRCARAGSTSAR